MDTRASRRIPFSLDAEIVSEDNTFNGYIENISQDGIECLMSTHVQSPADFTQNKILSINFQVPSGDEFNLKCELMWYLEASPHDKKLLLGMKIISPPSRYKNLVNNLNC